MRGEEEVAEQVVVHHEPIHIPSSALPPRPGPPPGATFALTFVIGAAGAPWFAAALVSGGTVPVYFAVAWLAVLGVELGMSLRR